MARNKIFITVKKQATQSTINYVQLIADGNTVAEIAAKEKVKVRTLESHIQNIRSEFSAQNLSNLVAIFFRNKLIK